jgi:hypothetical protein
MQEEKQHQTPPDPKTHSKPETTQTTQREGESTIPRHDETWITAQKSADPDNPQKRKK